MKVPIGLVLAVGCMMWGGCSAPNNTYPVKEADNFRLPVKVTMVKPPSSNADT